MKKIHRPSHVKMNFHQAKWDEPVIFELSQPGERGVVVPSCCGGIAKEVGDGLSAIPESMRRKTPPALPEVAQHRVLRHYFRLSQQTLGADLNLEIGQGTCTVKYSPKINEQMARSPKMTEIHPAQDPDTVQGILEITYALEQYLKEISGMDRFTMEPSGGSQAIMAMASIVKAYFDDKGEDRDEIITTIYSHPSDAAGPTIKGYKIIKIMPDKDGYPDLEAFKAALSPKTAAFFIANPEDTGVYNTNITEFTRLVHEAGGLCCYDQANANGLLGVTRAKEAGFDMCFFNLHKTFSTPHGCGGPATGALGVLAYLIPYLPGPLADFDGEKYVLAEGSDKSLGKIRSWLGVAQNFLKAYMWVRAMGAEGLYEAAKIAVLNNNYMFQKLMELPFVDAPYIPGKQRIEQVRYSMEKMLEETGVSVADVQRRMMDFGMHFWLSHHPFYVPEPMTLEPTETPSKEDLDEYIDTLKQIFKEAYENPDKVLTAPHQSVVSRLDESHMDDPAEWAITWRSYLKKAHD